MEESNSKVKPPNSTKRLIVLEATLLVLFLSRLLLGCLGARLNAERITKSVEKLHDIPEAIAGWEWDRSETDKTANILHVTGGGYNLFVRSYVRPATGERLYFQVCRWLDPLSCYELHGWQIAKAGDSPLTGEEGRMLRAAGFREGRIEKNEERMYLLFWESDLLEPAVVRKGALTEDAGAKGRLSRLWGRTHRRIKSFFQKSDIVAKVIYLEETQSDEAREAVLRFAREVHEVLPRVLK
jgi:hypothetical protein